MKYISKSLSDTIKISGIQDNVEAFFNLWKDEKFRKEICSENYISQEYYKVLENNHNWKYLICEVYFNEPFHFLAFDYKYKSDNTYIKASYEFALWLKDVFQCPDCKTIYETEYDRDICLAKCEQEIFDQWEEIEKEHM